VWWVPDQRRFSDRRRARDCGPGQLTWSRTAVSPQHARWQR
jgi:hypothetical protein